MVLVFDYFMLIVINDIHSVKHTIIGLYKDLVAVLVEVKFVDLGLENNEI